MNYPAIFLFFPQKMRLVSGDRIANGVGGFPTSCSYIWCRRISSPRHVLLRQARSIVGDGFRILNRGFWWIIFKVVGVDMNFLVVSLQLEKGIQLLSGDGTKP